MSTRRDCTCPRARHQHGTLRAYNADRCRCLRCRAAHANATRVYRNGGSWREGRVDATGTVRRLRALAVIGVTASRVSDATGLSLGVVSKLRNARECYVSSARTVADAYEQLTTRPQIGPDSRRCRTQALARGWLPPIAWDDDTIDDPDAQPMIAPPLPVVLWIERNRMHIERVRTFDEIAVERYIAGTLKHRPQHPHTPELVEAVRRMREAGLSGSEIGRRVGLTGDAVVKLRERRLGDAA